MEFGHRKFDFSVHVSHYDGFKDAKRYRNGFDRATFPLDSMAELISRFCWSPIVWKNGVRLSENFWFSDIVALDFDTPEYSLDQALNEWCDTVHIIGTTASHRKEKNGVVCDRFRIISIWDQAITNPELYTASLKKLMRENRAEYADDKCVDGARFFFPCLDIISVTAEGEAVESVKEIPKQARSEPTMLSMLPSRALKFLQKAVPAGTRNFSTYKFAFDCARCGYKAEHVIDWVRKSKTYQKETDKRVLGYEIPATVRSAFKSFERYINEQK
jgi:hypothetical protein